MDKDQSFVEFTRVNYTSLFRTAVLLTGSFAAGEDLVQDTLTRLYPSWWRVDAADLPLAYVRKSLTNRFLTSRRGFAVQLLAHLSQRQRAAIVMRFFHDMDDEEIAVSIGCRRVTVRSLISRGLVSMRRESDRSEGVRPGVSRGSMT